MGKVLSKNGYTLSVEPDDCGTDNDPRQWDNLGKMVCFHGRYNLGDKHDFKTPQDFKAYLEGDEFGSEVVVKLPLYLYDHSGITMSTSSFNDSWDSGQVGVIYATAQDVLKEYGNGAKVVTPEMVEKATKALEAEVKIYDTYIRNDIYMFSIEDEDGEVVDSCGGFFGEEDAIGDGKLALNRLAKRKGGGKHGKD